MKHWQEYTSIEEWIADIDEQDRTIWIESLILSSNLSPPEKVDLENMLFEPDMDIELQQMMITYLLENQVDRIDAGFNYSMKDIQNKLNKLI